MNETKQPAPGMLRNSIFMFVATQFANVANLSFQMIAGRRLPNDEYGILATMMSVFLIASTPLDALRTAMAHFSARAMRTGDTGAIRWLINAWSRRMIWLALLIVGIGFIFRSNAAVFFQLESGTPFVFACGLISLALFLPLMTGVFQGMQNFYWMSASMHIWTIVRIGLILFLLSFTATALAGLAAHALATLFGLLISLYGLHVLTRNTPVSRPTTGIGGFFVRSLFMLGSYAVLMNADLIFIKHLFHPDDAGEFAKAATIGRSVIFMPMPIALVMFPKVITSGPSTRDSRLTLLKALGMVAILIGTAVGVTIAMPWLPLWIIYGIKEPSPELVRLLYTIVCAMAPLALTFLLMNYEIAQHRFTMIWLLVVCAILYVAGVVIWHETMEQVVWVLAGVSTLSAVGFSAAIIWRAGKRHQILVQSAHE
ncbi:MAG TPA: hypothetical protein PJ991_04050 [Kiritimatiellia bacterium]|nr:hypothetical protein [Kiritimatiellia bacterium]